MNIDILLRRYNTIRKAWTNSRTPEEEQEWYDKLQIIEKEIKAFITIVESGFPQFF